MKKLMLLACGILMASIQLKVYAQKEGLYVVPINSSEEGMSDTLVISMKGSDKVLIIGKELKKIVNDSRLDSIRLLFLNDIESARAGKTLNPEAQKVFYFIDKNGKRRLKAENPEYSENSVDVGYEITRLKLDLPKYEYHIYDLANGLRIQVYIADPAELKNTLGQVSLNQAAEQAKLNGKKELKRNYKMEVSAADHEYKVTSRTRGRIDYIEAVPALGVRLIGNTLSPVFAADAWIKFSDKYSVPQLKFGAGIGTLTLPTWTGDEITDVSMVGMYNFMFAGNVSHNSKKPYWMGFQVGFMQSSTSSSLNKAKSFGFLIEGAGLLNYSFDIIRDANKKTIYGVTVKLPF